MIREPRSTCSSTRHAVAASPGQAPSECALAGGQERPRRLRLAQAAPHEHLREHVRAAQLRGQPRGGGERVRSDLQARVHDALRLGAREDGNRAHCYGMAPADFPAGFFERVPAPRRSQAAQLDDAAVAALRDLYSDLGIDGRVLDVGSSSADHFDVPPDELVAFGGDLDERLPYGDDAFDDVLCSGAVGRADAPARDLRRDRPRRCVPAGAWCARSRARCTCRARSAAGSRPTTPAACGSCAPTSRWPSAFGPAESDLRTSLTGSGDRLWAVWAAKRRP